MWPRRLLKALLVNGHWCGCVCPRNEVRILKGETQTTLINQNSHLFHQSGMNGCGGLNEREKWDIVVVIRNVLYCYVFCMDRNFRFSLVRFVLGVWSGWSDRVGREPMIPRLKAIRGYVRKASARIILCRHFDEVDGLRWAGQLELHDQQQTPYQWSK